MASTESEDVLVLGLVDERGSEGGWDCGQEALGTNTVGSTQLYLTKAAVPRMRGGVETEFLKSL